MRRTVVQLGVQFLAFLLLAVLATREARAQSPLTPHTLKLESKEAMPAARIEDAAWLAGHWEGEGLDGVLEEIWAPPRGGAMMGMYRLVKEGAPVFYELFVIVEESSSLILKLKHFHPDLSGWEDSAAEAAVHFPLVKMTPTEIFFGGLTYQKVDENTLIIYLALHLKDGTIREEKFTVHRVKSQ